MSSIYSRIFATTSRRFTSAAGAFKNLPSAGLWALPAAVGASWFIWDALTPDLRSSVGLYWDPDAVLKRVEAERTQRLEAKEALKAAAKPAKDEEEEEEEEEEAGEEEGEEEVTAEDIEEAVSSAVEDAGESEEGEGEEEEKEVEAEEDEEEEEEEEAPKKKKVDFKSLTLEEKWEYFAETSIVPGEDDDDEVGIFVRIADFYSYSRFQPSSTLTSSCSIACLLFIVTALFSLQDEDVSYITMLIDRTVYFFRGLCLLPPFF